MHAVVRQYSGVSELVNAMMERRSEVEEIIKDVRGFRAYYAVSNGDALTTITICDDSSGTEESTQVAAQWVRDNLPDLVASPPEVLEGDVFLALSSE